MNRAETEWSGKMHTDSLRGRSQSSIFIKQLTPVLSSVFEVMPLDEGWTLLLFVSVRFFLERIRNGGLALNQGEILKFNKTFQAKRNS